MAFKIIGCDNIRESFSAANSTTISLGGAVSNSNTIGSKLSNGDTSWFAVRNGAEFSEGEFTYNTGTPNTLTQTTVKKSSNGNAAVTFSSGNGEAYIDLPTYVADLLNLVEITVASATTCDIGAVDGAKIVISGTTTITGFGTSTNKLRLVRFSGALTLTHDGTSLILPGAANIITVAGDTAIFTSDSSGNWRCRQYQPTSGYPLNGVRSKLITFTRLLSAASNSVAYTGVGFKPSAIICTGGINTTSSYSMALGVVDSARSGASLGYYNGGFAVPLANFIDVIDSTASNEVTGDVSSFDTDGFTISWTKINSPTGTVTFFALCLR